jgi:hypothetical protein
VVQQGRSKPLAKRDGERVPWAWARRIEMAIRVLRRP